ncbi:GNAT family N-acetyltransferase [Cohnella faecalis]|uniref:GNAT family N-acetyltransferase n=2 Tax=Cohnella faecalis TaxID=2315694 RepID=A0A398CMM6_9BACL|nr:GNAT family N-acetyltransferase [Cohnella faecalis]
MIQILLYTNMAMLLLAYVSAISTMKAGDVTGRSIGVIAVNLFLPIASLYLAQRSINRKQFVPSLLFSMLLIFFTLTNMIQMVVGLIILLMFFVLSTRAYFKGEIRAEKAEQRIETGESGDEGESEGESAEEQVKALPSSDQTAPVSRPRHDPIVEIREAGEEEAGTIHALMMGAFEEYRAAVPPSSALSETVESIREAIRNGSESAAILYEDDKAAAMVRFRMEEDSIYFFRLSVLPARRRRGYAKKLIQWIEQRGVGQGKLYSRCKVRQSVQNNMVLYQDRGYEIIDQELVVRPEGSVKALKMEKKLGPV